MLSDTTAALHVVRAGQPLKLKKAFNQGKKEGKKTGFAWGLTTGILTILGIIVAAAK